MSAEKNKAIVREYLEQVWIRRRTDLIEQYLAEDFVIHDAPGLTDRASVQKFIPMFLEAFPDFRGRIDAEIAEGDLVVFRETLTGTQQGEFMGIPASGKQITWKAIYVFRVSNGKIIDIWGFADSMSMMQQMGATPVPAAA